ncbi:scavenger receptor class B member 1 isoform X4 [Nasonia vitripennis]|uniref:Scavenger receptor class B member 1 n=1 Tax=Nasonia vitripennis TaxID=7425 RepID=A0A7M7INI8_NASVI|nr:scavenger receptor class B member 1 isoform X4 [Nasonia vitripennis]
MRMFGKEGKGPRNKVEPTKDVPKKLLKDPLQDVPRRPLGLTEVLILDTPRVPLQPTSKSIFVLMTIGLLGLVTGCVVLVLQPYEFIFKWKATFGEGGEIYEIWRAPPVDLYLKVYLFNITNHEAYMNREETKLKFEQIGPYVYKEYLEHGNVTFNDNGTVTAVPLHPLKFMPELSNGTEEDIVVMPNIALLSIANVMKDASYITRWGLNLLIRQTDSKPLVHMTAKEFMFGYESTLVTLGNNVMPAWIKFDRLGLIDRMYDFEGDYETVYTGETDPRLTGLIEKYNGNENLPQWSGKCANVKGSSDGAKFQSYIEPNDTLRFFRKSLCRSEAMIRTGEKYVKGLYSYKYKFMDHELDNGHFNPENKCFCRQGMCLPYGLIDVTDCYYGFPIALSYPHFYDSDPSLLEAVEGLSPVQELHESYFYIQPKSGLPVDLAFRFQINMALQDISAIEHVDGFSDLVLPLLWFEIGMHELPNNLNNKFFLYLNVLPAMQEVAIYGLFLAGAISLVWSVVKILTYKPKSSGITSQWLDADMQRKRLNYLNERRPSLKAKEMDVYFNALLTTKEEEIEPIEPSALEELPNLKEDIV